MNGFATNEVEIFSGHFFFRFKGIKVNHSQVEKSLGLLCFGTIISQLLDINYFFCFKFSWGKSFLKTEWFLSHLILKISFQ